MSGESLFLQGKSDPTPGPAHICLQLVHIIHDSAVIAVLKTVCCVLLTLNLQEIGH